MAYKKYVRKKRVLKRKRRTPAKAAFTALRMVKQIRKAEEVKKADSNVFVTALPVDQLGYVFNATQAAQGSSQYTRIGIDCLAKYVSINGVLSVPSAAIINAQQVVRFIVFVDRQEVANATPALTELLETTGTALAPYSFYNRTNVGRFRVIRDFKVALTQQYSVKPIKINLSFKKPHKVRYSGSTITSNRANSIWIAMLSNIPTATNNPTFQGTMRFGFTDD